MVKRVIDRWDLFDIVVVVVIIVVAVIVVAVIVVAVIVVVDFVLIALVVVVYPINLPLKFGQNRISTSWNITEIGFGWVVVVVVSFSCQTQVMLG